jgi:hypothetical protein
MAKPVILGINLDDIEWQPAEEVYGGKDVGLDVPSGMLVKVLWKDEETGASATLLKAPPGWTTPHPEFHSCTQEGFMIEGREIKGGIELVAPAYYCYPPGTVHGPVYSYGHTSLILMDGPFDVTYVTDDGFEDGGD